MSGTGSLESLAESLTAPRRVGIYTAITLALLAVWAFLVIVDMSGGGEFLILLAVGVGVPMALDQYGPEYETPWEALLWTSASCVFVAAVFTGLYLLATTTLSLSPSVASAVAFVVAYLTPYVALGAWQRR